MTEDAGLWGRLSTCGGLPTRLLACWKWPPSSVCQPARRVHPALQKLPGVTVFREPQCV